MRGFFEVLIYVQSFMKFRVLIPLHVLYEYKYVLGYILGLKKYLFFIQAYTLYLASLTDRLADNCLGLYLLTFQNA